MFVINLKNVKKTSFLPAAEVVKMGTVDNNKEPVNSGEKPHDAYTDNKKA